MHALHLLFTFESGDRVAIFAFLPPILRVNPTKQISIPYQRRYRLTGLLYYIDIPLINVCYINIC